MNSNIKNTDKTSVKLINGIIYKKVNSEYDFLNEIRAYKSLSKIDFKYCFFPELLGYDIDNKIIKIKNIEGTINGFDIIDKLKTNINFGISFFSKLGFIFNKLHNYKNEVNEVFDKLKNIQYDEKQKKSFLNCFILDNQKDFFKLFNKFGIIREGLTNYIDSFDYNFQEDYVLGHGDITFDNILYRDGDFFLIDLSGFGIVNKYIEINNIINMINYINIDLYLDAFNNSYGEYDKEKLLLFSIYNSLNTPLI